jgi:hypothetical protein
MAFIAFASAKGSPGVSTAVAALAATWPADRDLLVVEADPSGGDLVVRFDLATEPGLVTLAAAGRRELGAGTLLAHTQELPQLSTDVTARRLLLAAPVAADQAGAALSSLRGSLAPTLDQVDMDVLVDCGRIDPGSPALELASDADLLVMVARPVVAEVHHLASRLGSVKPQTLSVLMVGEHPYSVSEVATAVSASPLGTLAADARAATVLSEGHPNAARVLRRSRLLRDARALAEGLAAWLGAGAGTGGTPTHSAAGAAAPGPAGGPVPGPPGAPQVTAPPGTAPGSPHPSPPPAVVPPTSMPTRTPGSAPAPAGPGHDLAAPGTIAPAPLLLPPPPSSPPRPPSPPQATPARDLAPVAGPDGRSPRPPLPPPPRFSPLLADAEPDDLAAQGAGLRPGDARPKHFRRRGTEEPGR